MSSNIDGSIFVYIQRITRQMIIDGKIYNRTAAYKSMSRAQGGFPVAPGESTIHICIEAHIADARRTHEIAFVVIVAAPGKIRTCNSRDGKAQIEHMIIMFSDQGIGIGAEL